MTPNPMDPEGLPAVPQFRNIDWNPSANPEPAPSPGDVTVPNGPLAGGRADGPNGVGEPAPGEAGGSAPGGVEYALPDGGVYTSPPGLPSTWSYADMQSYYNTVCITDALALVTDGPPPRAPLLDEAGWETCDDVEGQLFDEADAIAEAQEAAEATVEAEEEAAESPNGQAEYPEYGAPGDISPGNMMSGALSPGEVAPSINTLDMINGRNRWQRGFRRMERNFGQWVRRRNANGFFDPGNTKGINYALGLEHDPILAGPDPEDDPEFVRPTEIEKMVEGIRAVGSLPFVPYILPEGYSWVPAQRAEFGNNWERVKRLADFCGRDNLLKAIPTPPQFRMGKGTPGTDFTPRLLGLYGLHGSLVTPEIYAQTSWRTKQWLEDGRTAPYPYWVGKMFINPRQRFLKKLYKAKNMKYLALFGIIGAAWGLIQGLHYQHEKHLAEQGIPQQKWNEPMKEGYGPWIITESAFTTTVDGVAQVSTVTEYTQYFPGSTKYLSPSEIFEQDWPTMTDAPAAADGGLTTVTAPAAEKTPAAPDYLGIARLPPLTVYVPTTTTVAPGNVPASPTPAAGESQEGEPSPSPKAAPLNYMDPDRLLQLGTPITPANDHVEPPGPVDDTPPPPPILTSNSGPPFVWPTHPPRPHDKPHGAYANNTDTASNSTDDTSSSSNATSPGSHNPYAAYSRINYTAVTFPNPKPNIPKSPGNVTAAPYGFPNGTSSLPDHGFLNGTDGYSNTTHGYANMTSGYANMTSGYANMTSTPRGKLRYLRGAAPWDGVVVPEVADVVPTGDGKWACQWVPSLA